MNTLALVIIIQYLQSVGRSSLFSPVFEHHDQPSGKCGTHFYQRLALLRVHAKESLLTYLDLETVMCKTLSLVALVNSNQCSDHVLHILFTGLLL